MRSGEPLFLPGVPAEHVLRRLRQAGGKEVESGKFNSPESSAALAVNCFGWFIPRPQKLPRLPGLSEVDWPAVTVDVEYCARFPWSGGRHPWLDAVVQTAGWLVGVESKRYEPFRDRKTVSLSSAYDRPVWGEGMAPFEQLRDRLRSGEEKFVYLDAAQLVKHGFGLVTDGRRRGKQTALAYVYAEPEARGKSPIGNEARAGHRQEIERFSALVKGATIRFTAFSYREWLETWREPDLQAHSEAVVARFGP